MQRAVALFLSSAGLPLRDPSLEGTPKRVADAWANEFLDGYQTTPEEALGELFAAPKDSRGEMVVVADLRFHSMCPHHLLPVEGRAHLAYVPSRRLAGFGRLSFLLDCFAHRLILQEELASLTAKALAEVLKSPATACVLEARQSCLRVRGDEQRDAWTHVEAYEGRLRTDRDLRRQLWARLGKHVGQKKGRGA
jgi:GTP cyclohydrolase I